MLYEVGIFDTCFVIDWLKYSNYKLIFKLFKELAITTEVLKEIKGENVLKALLELMKDDLVFLVEPHEAQIGRALQLVKISREIPHLPTLDFAEALGLVIARDYGFVLLTENKAALYAPKFFKEYSNVKVLRSFDVFVELYKLGVLDCNELKREVERYSSETLHVFPKRDLKRLEACDFDRETD